MRWGKRWADHDRLQPPAGLVVESSRFLPEVGEALDVAGGMGRHSLFLAARGLHVTLVDVSPAVLTPPVELASASWRGDRHDAA